MLVRFVNDAAVTVLIVISCYWLGWAAVDFVKWLLKGKRKER